MSRLCAVVALIFRPQSESRRAALVCKMFHIHKVVGALGRTAYRSSQLNIAGRQQLVANSAVRTATTSAAEPTIKTSTSAVAGGDESRKSKSMLKGINETLEGI